MKRAYLIGVKGAAMAGLAQLLKADGYAVSGSDAADHFFTDQILKKAGIRCYEGFSQNNLPSGKDVWFISSEAYLIPPVANPEVLELKKKKIPISSYSEAVAVLFNQRNGIAVSGTHGKTTTAALVAHILHTAGKKPRALVGGEVINWRSNAKSGQGEIFVLEADEYREQFLRYKPAVIAITNIDYDHPDYFKNRSRYLQAFRRFGRNLKKGGKTFYGWKLKERDMPFASRLIGEHNRRNILLAAAVAAHLNISESVIRKAVASFRGVRRRLEKLGKHKGNEVFDDYAHNPEKVKASLEALCEAYPDCELSVIFQPHTFTRTKKFLNEFALSLVKADHIFLLDIYGSAREKSGGVSSGDLAAAVRKLGRPVLNLNTAEKAEAFLRSGKMPPGVWVTMGAGDVFKVGYSLFRHCEAA